MRTHIYIYRHLYIYAQKTSAFHNQLFFLASFDLSAVHTHNTRTPAIAHIKLHSLITTNMLCQTNKTKSKWNKNLHKINFGVVKIGKVLPGQPHHGKISLATQSPNQMFELGNRSTSVVCGHPTKPSATLKLKNWALVLPSGSVVKPTLTITCCSRLKKRQRRQSFDKNTGTA